MRLMRVMAMVVLAASVVVSAQETRTFKARLSTMPVEAATAAALTGSGEATATLTGTRLVVKGTFKGLQGAATAARLHVAPPGMRGPAMVDLEITKAASGTITADLELTPVQADHIMRSRVYLQVHSEKAPDGALRGWLLP